MRRQAALLLFSTLLIAVHGRGDSNVLERTVEKTVGQVWPYPQAIDSQSTVLSLDPATFEFQNGDKCEVIDLAFIRYKQLIFNPQRSSYNAVQPPEFNHLTFEEYANFTLSGQLRGQLPYLDVHLDSNCETWPSLYMDEQYQLKIDTEEIPLQGALIAPSVWGILRGLETFSQLVYKDSKTGLFLINSTFILDFPRFTHRGVLLDTSRHYVPTHIIKENLDAMSYNKFNAFHWHIVDDQSFPYQSLRFPNMSEFGAYDPVHRIYTPDDVRNIVNYARLRGIRVVPEFDTPGHTESWGASISDLLTPCYNANSSVPNGKYGPINPTLESTYDFLAELFTETITLFPDSYMHVGGDEVPFDCWLSNPFISDFMLQMNISTPEQLESYYLVKLLDIIQSLNQTPIVWQEVFDNNNELSKETVIEVWKTGGMAEMNKVTKAGYRAMFSSCWYLDYIYGASDWKRFYLCDPLDFNGTAQQNSLVIGGEACLWGEYVDGSNLTPRLWPRASAVAERLWSNKTQNNTQEAEPRLEGHRCLMMLRGINAEPQSGPGFCDGDYLI